MSANKHFSWAYEDEVRLVHMQTIAPPQSDWHQVLEWTGMLPDGHPIKWLEPLRRSTTVSEVNFLAFPFGRFRNGAFDPTCAIAEVIIGPKCTLTSDSVTSALAEQGFQNVVVVKSDCQIR